MFRQLNNKDCAVTVMAHALSLPYTTVVNSIPGFRFKRSRKRLWNDVKDRVVGKAQRTVNPFHQISGECTDYLYIGYYRYDMKYRVSREPYFCGFGLTDVDYEPLITKAGYRMVERVHCPPAILRRIPFAIVSLPSINVKKSGHLIMMRYGMIFDPSPKKRFTYARIRKARYVNVHALCRSVEESVRVKKIMYSDIKESKLSGINIIFRLVTEVSKTASDPNVKPLLDEMAGLLSKKHVTMTDGVGWKPVEWVETIHPE